MILKPRGTEDILPENAPIWQHIEGKIRNICKNAGFNEIRTPLFENTELFCRGIGGTTDVVQKEMYTFDDKGGRSITLKPEGTAGAIRSFIENSMYGNVQPTKLFYITPCYRYEKPQSGRLREFHQFGVECLGSDNPVCDTDVILLAVNFFESLGLKINLSINSIGCEICRKDYYEKLKAYFSQYYDLLCSDCKSRLDRNPMRILDCKICAKNENTREIIKSAPKMLDNLCDNCRDHFEYVKDYLDNLGLTYRINPTIVRGLDYYTKTVFEITEAAGDLAICGGGRYNNLVSELGGKDVPAIGFGIGLERLIMVIPKNSNEFLPPVPSLFIAVTDQKFANFTQKLVNLLRKSGFYVEYDLLMRSLKAQMKYADKLGAKFSVVLGENEINAHAAKFRDMKTKEEFLVNLDVDDIISILKSMENRTAVKN